MPDVLYIRHSVTETFPMLAVDHPRFRHGQHRARRRYLARRRCPVWREALAEIRKAIRSAPEATAFTVGLVALVAAALGGAS